MAPEGCTTGGRARTRFFCGTISASQKANGGQRLWINGRLVIEQTGMEWRKTDKLVLNNVMLSTNTSEPPRPGTSRTVWIDGIVLARHYIGPVERKKGK